MATVARENIGFLNDKITIKVSKEDYFPTFEKKIKEHSKTVNMPGFRKGMVPASMIKKMYGPSIYTDEILKAVEKKLYSYLDTEKPEIFAQPIALDADLRKLDVNNPADYEFGFEIGLKPAFELAPLDKAPVTFNKVKVTDEMVEAEVSKMQIKSGKLTDQETINSEEAVLNVKFTECDKEGNPVEDGLKELETSVVVNYLTAEAQPLFMGKKVDDAVVIEFSKTFIKDKQEAFAQDLGLDKAAMEGVEKYFKLTILKIGLIKSRELNEEFFNEVFPGGAVATEDEFRIKLKEEIERYWEGQSRNQLHDQLYHYLLDNTNIEFPAEFLKRWLQTGSGERKTAEQAEAEFPVFASQLKWTLITEKIIKENNLQVTLQEVKETMRAQVMQYFGTISKGNDTSWIDNYVDGLMKDKKQVDEIYNRIGSAKIFNYIESLAKPIEKEVTPEELDGMQHHH